MQNETAERNRSNFGDMLQLIKELNQPGKGSKQQQQPLVQTYANLGQGDLRNRAEMKWVENKSIVALFTWEVEWSSAGTEGGEFLLIRKILAYFGRFAPSLQAPEQEGCPFSHQICNYGIWSVISVLDSIAQLLNVKELKICPNSSLCNKHSDRWGPFSPNHPVRLFFFSSFVLAGEMFVWYRPAPAGLSGLLVFPLFLSLKTECTRNADNGEEADLRWRFDLPALLCLI